MAPVVEAWQIDVRGCPSRRMHEVYSSCATTLRGVAEDSEDGRYRRESRRGGCCLVARHAEEC